MRSDTVIFICSFNSVRSPIAEGFLRQRERGRYTVCSAGIAPIRVRPSAVRVMQEMKIDISGHIPASLYHYRTQDFDYVVTLCDNVRAAAEEVLPGGDRFFHRNFVSPQEIGKTPEETLADYRTLRDEIALWLDEIFPAATQDPDKNNGKKNMDCTATQEVSGQGQS